MVAPQLTIGACRWGDVRFERMVIQAGDNSFTLPFHPRLTVIAGVGPAERAAIVGELVGALGTRRSNVHLEVVEDGGRRLAVFRPQGGRHRVVDIDRSTDVSPEFRGPAGRIDVLGRHGLDVPTARRALRLNQSDLHASAHGDDLVRLLAEVDQIELWSTAARLRATADELQPLIEDVGSAPEDAAIIERVERRHHAVEAATGQHRKLRRYAVLLGIAASVIGIPVALVDPLRAVPILAMAVLTLLLALSYRTRVASTCAAEKQALSEAGAESYSGFQLQRVNGLLADSAHRHRLMQIAENHRECSRRWTEVAGDVDVDWALGHHEQITAAAHLRRDLLTSGTLSPVGPEPSAAEAGDLADALISRLTVLRDLGAFGEGFPLILDEPFGGLDESIKSTLLDLLRRAAGDPQIVVLTNDEDVACWGRAGKPTGDLAVVEPRPHGAHQIGDLAATTT